MRTIYFLKRISKETDGITAIEYALLASLIAMVILSSIIGLGISLSNLWAWVAGCVTNLSCS